MFKFFKKKLKNTVSRLSRQIDEETEPVKPEEPVQQEQPKKKGFFGKVFTKKEKTEPEQPSEKEPSKELPAEEKPEPEKQEKAEPTPPKQEESAQKKTQVKPPKPEKGEAPEQKAEPAEKKKGLFGKVKEGITKKSLSEKEFEKLFWDLEMVLMENNVAVGVIEKIKQDLKSELVDRKVLRGKTEEVIKDTLKNSIQGLFDTEQINLLQKVKQKGEKPYILLFVGINGTGKTTTIAKVAKLLQKNNLEPVIAASDTFRAAAIQQLEKHADKLGVKMIKHDYGSDPAAVAFDAVKYAKSKGLDVVLIDTAGRMHSNVNLMDEIKKIIRVVQPDLKVFVGDSLTGNDCIEQSKEFNSAVGIDAIILAKTDVDEKGGAALSVSYVTKKPIMYLGVGQGYDALEPFDSAKLLQRLGLEA